MSPQQHSHTHAPGERHPHTAAPPSLLRFALAQRLAVAAALIALMWGAVIWAIGLKA